MGPFLFLFVFFFVLFVQMFEYVVAVCCVLFNCGCLCNCFFPGTLP